MAEIMTFVIMWMYSMQICGQLCANILLESTFFRILASVFTNLWKTANHISSVTWPARALEINVIENV